MDIDEAVDVPFSIEGYGIGFEDAWLTKDGGRIIWLSPEHRHRPSSALVMESAVVIRTTYDQLLMSGFKDQVRYPSGGPFVQYGQFL